MSKESACKVVKFNLDGPYDDDIISIEFCPFDIMLMKELLEKTVLSNTTNLSEIKWYVKLHNRFTDADSIYIGEKNKAIAKKLLKGEPVDEDIE